MRSPVTESLSSEGKPPVCGWMASSIDLWCCGFDRLYCQLPWGGRGRRKNRHEAINHPRQNLGFFFAYTRSEKFDVCP